MTEPAGEGKIILISMPAKNSEQGFILSFFMECL